MEFFSVETKQILSFASETTKKELEFYLTQAAKKSLLKLESQSVINETNLYYETLSQLFNPSVAGSKPSINVKQTIVLFKNLPLFNLLTESQCIEGYQHFFKQLLEIIKSDLKPDILQLLLATKVKYEEFSCAAIKSIWCPVNSVDVERFFSKYNLIVTDRRTNLKKLSVEICSMINFNKY